MAQRHVLCREPGGLALAARAHGMAGLRIAGAHLMPPLERVPLAMFEHAAMTDGSSSAMGTRYSCVAIHKTASHGQSRSSRARATAIARARLWLISPADGCRATLLFASAAGLSSPCRSP